MANSFQNTVEKVVRAMTEWPVVGRFVKIAWAIFRLPEIRDACLVLTNRQHVLETERIPELQAAILALSHRQDALETGQIPALQESISSLNDRQTSTDSDRNNLVTSVPVSLRQITREIADIRNQLERAKNSNGRHNGKD